MNYYRRLLGFINRLPVMGYFYLITIFAIMVMLCGTAHEHMIMKVEMQYTDKGEIDVEKEIPHRDLGLPDE